MCKAWQIESIDQQSALSFLIIILITLIRHHKAPGRLTGKTWPKNPTIGGQILRKVRQPMMLWAGEGQAAVQSLEGDKGNNPLSFIEEEGSDGFTIDLISKRVLCLITSSMWRTCTILWGEKREIGGWQIDQNIGMIGSDQIQDIWGIEKWIRGFFQFIPIYFMMLLLD